jgi:hypothetical protein
MNIKNIGVGFMAGGNFLFFSSVATKPSLEFTQILNELLPSSCRLLALLILLP